MRNHDEALQAITEYENKKKDDPRQSNNEIIIYLFHFAKAMIYDFKLLHGLIRIDIDTTTNKRHWIFDGNDNSVRVVFDYLREQEREKKREKNYYITGDSD